MKHCLSKSRYIRGLQCEKALYLDTFSPEVGEFDYATRQKFLMGRQFERRFKDQFPQGIDISKKVGRFVSKSPVLTEQFLQQVGEIVLFEAGFMYDGVLVLADVLRKNPDGSIDIFEVKNVEQVSSVIRNDVYVQHYVIRHCVDNLHSFSVVYHDDQGFLMEELSKEALENAAIVAQNVARFKEVINGLEPTIEMGEQCNNPYECPYRKYCSGMGSNQLNLKFLW